MLLRISALLGGPFITGYLLAASKGFKFDDAWKRNAIAFVSIALLSSFIGYRMALPKSETPEELFWKTIKRGLVTVLVLMIAFTALFGSPEDRAWLPVLVLFIPIFSGPTLLGASYYFTRGASDGDSD